MSERRFTVMKKFDGSYVICDKGKMLVADDCCDLLNEQQEHITHLEDTNDNFRIKLIEDIEAMEQAEKKIGEQQAKIEKLEKQLEQIPKSIREVWLE